MSDQCDHCNHSISEFQKLVPSDDLESEITIPVCLYMDDDACLCMKHTKE